MELSLNYTFGGAEAIADSVHHPSIRLFTVAWHKSATPLNDTANRWSGGSWRVASPEAVDCGPGCGFGYFASTCYYYGLAIDVALQGRVPLGLMQVTYGGTWVEEWTRAEVVAQCGAVPHNNATTGQIWNAMVAPVVNITTQLTLWYQVTALTLARSHTLTRCHDTAPRCCRDALACSCVWCVSYLAVSLSADRARRTRTAARMRCTTAARSER